MVIKDISRIPNDFEGRVLAVAVDTKIKEIETMLAKAGYDLERLDIKVNYYGSRLLLQVITEEIDLKIDTWSHPAKVYRQNDKKDMRSGFPLFWRLFEKMSGYQGGCGSPWENRNGNRTYHYQFSVSL